MQLTITSNYFIQSFKQTTMTNEQQKDDALWQVAKKRAAFKKQFGTTPKKYLLEKSN